MVAYAKAALRRTAAIRAYLSRYTHWGPIANSPLISSDKRGVTIRWKDYRARVGAEGHEWIKIMMLAPDEFIRRVLPDGVHHIRQYGLFVSGVRAANLAKGP